MISYFPLVSSIISAIFAILLLAQYIQRRKKHQLVWTAALTMFFLTTLFEFLAEPEVFGGEFVLQNRNATNTISIYLGSTTRVAQHVTLSNETINSLSFKMTKIGSPLGLIYAKIRKASDDTVIATSENLSIINMGTEYEWHKFHFSSPINVNEDVRLTLEFESGDSSNYLSVYYSDNNVSGVLSTYDTSWRDDSTSDLSIIVTKKEPSNGIVLMYKVYYILAPPMVALLGVGTLFLLTHKPWGKYFLMYTVILSFPLFASGLIASVDPEDLSGGFKIAGRVMPQHVRIFSPLFTIPGGILLIGGALYSYWLDRTRNYNLLIALGGIFPFFGGLEARFGGETFFYAFETIGTILLFLGFLLSKEYIKKQAELRKKRG